MKKINEVIKKCEIVERVGAKSGNPYMAVDIELTSGYKDSMFLSRELTELIKIYKTSGKKINEIIQSCEFVENTSSKGENYIAVEIVLFDGYKEFAFPKYGLSAIIKVLRGK